MSAAAVDFLAWGVATRPLESQPVSGDLHVVAPFDGGVLVAVIDGLGHGPDAATAARRAGDVLMAHADRTVSELLGLCHRALFGTRGAVASLASIERKGRMTWAGIGNVEALMVRADAEGLPHRHHLSPRGGVLGANLPHVSVTELQLMHGDTLAMASDGLHGRFVEAVTSWELPQAMADRLLKQFGKGNDDALVWIARFVEVAP